jgi:hypothetical protein
VAAIVLSFSEGSRGHWWDEPPPTPTPAAAVAPTPTSGPPCEIDVLEFEPAVPFELVGLVEVQGRGAFSEPSSALEAAKIRACQLGGSAIILLYRREGRRQGVEDRVTKRGTLLPEPELRVAVIRYR